MPLALAIVGPGRVGTALACLWQRAGCDLLGFAGGSSRSLARALELCPGARALAHRELALAHVVALTPGDDQLDSVVAESAASNVPRRCSLWLHTSGARGLEALDPLRASGARLGVLHPLCPVPDPRAGVRDLPGKVATLLGEPRSWRLLELLALRAGLRPVRLDPAVDRALYHAACALAANGVTALADLVAQLLARSAGGAAGDLIGPALMLAALDASMRDGAAAALSGPVQRGDLGTVARHLDALARLAPEALPIYRALMAAAARLALRAGDLSSEQLDAIAAQLAEQLRRR
jgi:predicted short-subunit dehydrogenase-like oxidoreductase (DUF2520 family)